MFHPKLGCTYVVDPVGIGTDAGEDRGLLRVVASQAGAKTDNTLYIPLTFGVLAVQGATRITLKDSMIPNKLGSGIVGAIQQNH